MISERKHEANRRNAQKSTGPKTEEGKSKVKLNALRHGLYARTIVLPHEDEAAYQQRLDDWIAEMNPRTNREAYLVERAVRITWELDRADFHSRPGEGTPHLAIAPGHEPGGQRSDRSSARAARSRGEDHGGL